MPMMPNVNFSGAMGGLGALIAYFAIAFMIAGAIINIAFAIAVARDSARLARSAYRQRGNGPVQTHGTAFVGPGIWILATLLGGVFVAAIYWAIHHSSLRKAEPEAGGTPEAKEAL